MTLMRPIYDPGYVPPHTYAVILAGGSGTRLWPLSTNRIPKHLLALTGGDTLLQATARRLLGRIAPERIYTVTHRDHADQVRAQLRSIDPRLATRVLAEPKANNTLPAIAWATATIAHRDPAAVIGVFPSDHAIANDAAFHRDLEAAYEIAAQGPLVTIGIKPSAPETGYGYIHADGGRVLSFVEKPDRQTAERYLREGNYYWNSGMFFFSTSRLLEELRHREPAMDEAIGKIVRSGNEASLLREIYPSLKSISIDYGIMEKAANVAVVPATFDWNDLGSWEAIYEIREKDGHRNVVEGDVIARETESSLLLSQGGTLAAIGLEGMVVVRTKDAVLVCPRGRAQDVKGVVEELKRRGRAAAETHATVARPWGTYTVLEEGPGHKIKRIVVDPGHKLSLQRHRHRAEHWVVVEGTARVTNGTRETVLKSNESAFIPQGERHRLENPGDGPLTIIEVQTGTYLGEDDIERFDDVYGRMKEVTGT